MLKMEKEAAKDNPQVSKKAHHAFRYVTGSASKGGGLGDTVTWTTPGGPKVARGHQAVGAVVGEYTHSVSSAKTAEGEFCEEFRAPDHEAVARLNTEDRDFMANGATTEPITSAEVTSALKDLATRMHRSTELDEVYAWMVVLGGDVPAQCMVPCWHCTRRCGALGSSQDHGMRLGSPTSTRRGARLRCLTTGLSH